MKKYVCLMFFLLTVSFLYGQTIKPRVGILDFVANNMSENDARIVGEMFTSELVLSGEYDVVDRKNIESIMGEMDFQMSGCTDSSCALEIGQILSLDYMIYGSISLLGEDYIITVYMINVGTAQIEGSARERFKKIEESYDIMAVIIEKLVMGNTYGEDDQQQQVTEEETSESAKEKQPRTWFLETGAGGRANEYFAGLEIEAGVRILFNEKWGAGAGLIFAILQETYYKDISTTFNTYIRGYLQILEKIGLSLGLRGLNPCVGIYFGNFYVRAGYQIMNGPGFNADIGYSLQL